jgi:hypothetical protein
MSIDILYGYIVFGYVDTSSFTGLSDRLAQKVGLPG